MSTVSASIISAALGAGSEVTRGYLPSPPAVNHGKTQKPPRQCARDAAALRAVREDGLVDRLALFVLFVLLVLLLWMSAASRRHRRSEGEPHRWLSLDVVAFGRMGDR